MNVIEAIEKKSAVRAYSKEAVPTETIQLILDAGRKAQSSQNSQPCRFVVVREQTSLQALSRFGKYASHLPDAAFGIAILTPAPALNVSILFDAGQAAAYLQLAALEFGIGSCIIKLHQNEQAGKFLEIPEDYRLNFILSMGYPEMHPLGRSSGLNRLEAKDIVFWEKWGG